MNSSTVEISSFFYEHTHLDRACEPCVIQPNVFAVHFRKEWGEKMLWNANDAVNFVNQLSKVTLRHWRCWRVFYDSSSLTHCSVSIVDCFLCSTNRRTTYFFSKKLLSSICPYVHRHYTHISNINISVSVCMYIFLTRRSMTVYSLSAHVIWNIVYVGNTCVVCVFIFRSCFWYFSSPP